MRRPRYEHNQQYIETERFNEFMTQVYDALSAEIDQVAAEVATLETTKGTSDADLQKLADKLTPVLPESATPVSTPVTPVVPVVA